MTERGYIALARGVLDHPVVGAKRPYSKYEAWTWLLLEAAWKERRVHVSNGRTDSCATIQRGQLSYSLRYLARAWGWSVKPVRSFLNRLEKDTQIETQRGTAQTLITICNYETYQTTGIAGGTQAGIQSGTQRARKGHKTEEGKKETKDNGPSGFEDWYAIYPRKKKPDAARKAFDKVMAEGVITLPDLMAKTFAFATHWKAQSAERRQFIPYPASWLGSGEYRDEIETAMTQASGSIKIEAPTQRPEDFTKRDWASRLNLVAQGNAWPEYWGPAPGKPGCLVPSGLLP